MTARRVAKKAVAKKAVSRDTLTTLRRERDHYKDELERITKGVIEQAKDAVERGDVCDGVWDWVQAAGIEVKDYTPNDMSMRFRVNGDADEVEQRIRDHMSKMEGFERIDSLYWD